MDGSTNPKLQENENVFVTDEGAIPHYRRQATGGMSHRMLTSVCSDDSDGLEVRKLRSGVQS